MLLVPKEAYNSSGLLNIKNSSKSRFNTSKDIATLLLVYCLAFAIEGNATGSYIMKGQNICYS